MTRAEDAHEQINRLAECGQLGPAEATAIIERARDLIAQSPPEGKGPALDVLRALWKEHQCTR